MDDKVYEIKESSIADPGPLGLAGFALTTAALSASNAGIIPASLGLVFLPLALVYGGSVQMFAGMWEYKKNNTFGATAFTSFGAFWIALAIMLLLVFGKVISFGKDNSDLGIAIGFYLVLWTIFTFYLWIASFGISNGLATLFTLLLITFILLDVGNLGGGAVMVKVGGWFGILTALMAWYLSAAGVLNPMFKRVVLPVGPKVH
ncbi:MAG TPA: acetate uptake transporter [Spirochaetia bacterium]|nr:acetate uptake transporter [Spirochaetia bacterium]